MLVSTQTQFSLIPGIHSIIQIEDQSTELCIVGDGATDLAAGFILSGGRQNLRILSLDRVVDQDKKTGRSWFTNKRLPTVCQIRDRNEQLREAPAETAFSQVTSDCSMALRGADGVVVCAPATKYGDIAKALAPFLRNGQTIYLVDAPVAGGLEFANRLSSLTDEAQVNIVEMGGLFDYAKIENDTLIVSGQRDKVSFCGNSRNETRRGLEIANSLARELVPCSNVLERGFSEVERLIRPMLLLFAVLGARGKNLDCISNIINPAITSMVATMEGELQSLANAYDCVVHSFFDTLSDFSGARLEDADCLNQALISVSRRLLGQNLPDSSSGQSISVEVALEVLQRDVSETLVLISELARLSRTPVPVINSVIELASVATRTDLHKQGRGLAALGLVGFDTAEVVELINT